MLQRVPLGDPRAFNRLRVPFRALEFGEFSCLPFHEWLPASRRRSVGQRTDPDAGNTVLFRPPISAVPARRPHGDSDAVEARRDSGGGSLAGSFGHDLTAYLGPEPRRLDQSTPAIESNREFRY